MKKHPFQHNVTVGTDGNQQGHFNLNIDENLQNEHLLGIRVTRPGANRKSRNNNNLVNDAAFNASFLTLGQKNTLVGREIPLEEIALANDNGYWYEIDVPNLDLKTSTLRCVDPSLVVQGEDYQFVFKVLTSVGGYAK